MTFGLLFGALALVGLALCASIRWNLERRGSAASAAERRRARSQGSHAARLQFPNVDLARCLGCGTCVRACPEEGVLELVHGQALVVHGARCVGHGRCAEECPTGAISVSLADLAQRRDLPALDERHESPQVPGLFLAGELTGFALIRTAIAHGTQVASEVARRVRVAGTPAPEPAALDLCIVGAGPAGLACALEAKTHGLDFEWLDQEGVGGTVAKYPRRKLVMTQPVDLPRVGRMKQSSYSKEELMELWQRIVRDEQLPLRAGVVCLGLRRAQDGLLHVETDAGEVVARHVCLALGRRGTPRKLDVPGEELTKVSYGLLDAASFQGRRVLVVGGGDSAVEAALGLAEQSGNTVHLSYRRDAFARIKPRNAARLEAASAEGRLQLLLSSRVLRIDPERVVLECDGAQGTRSVELENDDVFVLVGGLPPFPLLEAAGVSFDPGDRPPAAEAASARSGLVRALTVASSLIAAALVWLYLRRDYYSLALAERPGAAHHELLRPAGVLGLAFGVLAAGLVAANLSYLLRRAPRFPLRLGSLGAWMTSHVATGLLALVLALLHSAMAPRDTVGGHALAALAVLVVSGVIGRYLYAFVPRAANGRELELDEVLTQVGALSAAWEQEDRELGQRIQAEVESLIEGAALGRSLPARVLGLVRAQGALRRALLRLRAQARAAGRSAGEIEGLAVLARRAHRAAFMAAHFDELRALLGTWRWIHRWTALGMVLLVVVHVVAGLRYARMGELG